MADLLSKGEQYQPVAGSSLQFGSASSDADRVSALNSPHLWRSPNDRSVGIRIRNFRGLLGLHFCYGPIGSLSSRLSCIAPSHQLLRLPGQLEATIGALMFGVSAAMVFAVIQRQFPVGMPGRACVDEVSDRIV
jgi:hypothetical protein